MANNAWIWVLAVFVLYFAILITIAVVRARQMHTMTDYVLGGRGLDKVTAALSAGSSSSSGWTMLVFPALAFTAGLMHFWTLASIILGLWLSWTIVAKRLRRYTIATHNSLTLPEFLEKRFNDRTGLLRTLSAVISLYFITLYICSGLIAGAKLLEEVFGLEQTGGGHDIGVIVTLIAVVSYTFIGGFLAVCRTDVFQALVMLAGFIIIPAYILFTVSSPFSGLEDTAPGFWNPFTDPENQPLGFLFFISSLGWGVGARGAQRVLARFMAVRDERSIGGSRNLSLLWVSAMFLLALLTGLIAAPALLDRGVVLPDAERLYLVVADTFFHPVVAGVLLTAVVAAVMSTADSQLLLASAIASDDAPIVKRITAAMGRDMKVWMGRLLLLLIGVVAALVSILSPESVFALVSLAWGGMGAAFGPAVVLALWWRRFNLWGALTAVTAGALTATFWWLMGLGNEGVTDLTTALGFSGAVDLLSNIGVWQVNPGVPGFVIAMALAYVVTKLTPPPSGDVTELFDFVTGPGWSEPAHPEEEELVTT